jgi:ribonuclease BN (tRNA processing enzyme)
MDNVAFPATLVAARGIALMPATGARGGLAWITMRLTVIGCAGSFPGPDSPASCYLIEADGFRLLLDLGNGAIGALQRHAGLTEVDAICLSHLHGDHCLDMCSYWVTQTWAPGGPRPPIPVYGPAGTAERLARAQGTDAAEDMSAAFTFETLVPGARQIGPFKVTLDHVNHPVETFGFRLERGGRALAYSADTGESDALVRLASGADLLLCEASFVDGAPNPPGLHLTGRQAGEHAARAGVGELVLTHLVPWNDQARMLAEAAGTFGGPLSLAASGRIFDLG